MHKYLAALEHISPDDYQNWITVGMALKHEGLPLSVWEEWSRRSAKHHDGECAAKWDSFNETSGGAPVTGGTLVAMAKQNGFIPSTTSQAFGWDDEVVEPGRDYKIVDAAYVGEERIPLPAAKYDPAADMREYLSILFEPDEYVCYCDKLTAVERGGKTRWVPQQSVRSRTAGQLIEALHKGVENASICGDSEGGALIRFNPLDGAGEGNANITRRSYCLIESDTDSLEKQYSLYKALNLPIAVLVHSGNKSLHAIVRVDAESPRQYRERVNFLYDFCQKNGLHVDTQDKNESRYSRLPGVKRNGRWQYIVATNMGPGSYDDWVEWVEEQNDNLPDDVSLADVWDDPPPLGEELISGILRVRHKMLLAGPSKAGKSFLLMLLAICMAEGLPWLGHQCRKGKVLYVNLELDHASCFRRFIDLYKALNLKPDNVANIRIWNLRGRAVPMDKLTPFLIRRFKDSGIEAVILDPIYKVITGDENDATEMSQFCSYFDRVCLEMGVAMIYCHHHSKGASAKYVKAADRSSGSGVFARDPDAILDLTELRLDAYARHRYQEQMPGCSESLTAWEMTGTLREFAPIEPVRLFFDYPLHQVDRWNFLSDAKNDQMVESGRGVGKGQLTVENWNALLDEAYEANCDDGSLKVPFEAIAGYIQRDGKPAEKTIKNNISNSMIYTLYTDKKSGIVYVIKR
jgi:RecA-family ATPase